MEDYFFVPKVFENTLDVNLIYRVGPNLTCEIIDIVSNKPYVGNGSIVYKEFEVFAKTQYDVKNMYAFTRFSNIKALNWYLKMGFSATWIPNFYFDEPEYKAIVLTKSI
jgi:hypothetical protein